MSEAQVRLIDVTRSFGSLNVLDSVSFDVARGEFVSIIGPSGAGKSTLFNILAGLDAPDGGSVELAGSTAYMPQKDLLFPWRTIEANAALGLEVQGMPKKEARARAREWFPQFGLDGFEDALPHELSGGMRQRAALLRTVVQEKSTLLLDEPFGALDNLTRHDLQMWMQQMWSEHEWTALLITHDVREAILLSDRIIVLSPRPATVRDIIKVDLPRPRGAEIAASPTFIELERRILGQL